MKKIFLFATLLVLMLSLLMVSVSAGYDASSGQWSVDSEVPSEAVSEFFGDGFSPNQVFGKYAYIFTTGSIYHGAIDSGMESGGPYELLKSPVYMGYGLNGENINFGMCSSMVINVGSVGITVVIDGQTENLYFDGINSWICYIFDDSLGMPQCFNTYGEDAFLDFYSTNALALIMHIMPLDQPEEHETIFTTWSGILEWVIDSIQGFTAAFYTNGQLTLLGYLAILPVAFGICLLVISIIKGMLQLR